jgi:CheY-like chemotaxis protein
MARSDRKGWCAMQKKDILIVDDDYITLNMLKATLAGAGYGVLLASNGLEAIKVAKEHLPFLIVLDIMMPDIDGGEVASILKKDPQTKGIPVIFLSSLISENEQKIDHRNDFISLISKPYTRKKLLDEIRKYYYRTDSGKLD